MTIYPTIQDALAYCAKILKIPPDQAQSRVRDLSMLESALNRPKTAAYYEGADVIEQAATLLCGIAKNHPFVDGNKRTAYVTMKAFLEANGWTIIASDVDKFTFMVAVAERLTTQEAAEWIRDRTEPFDR